MTTSALESRWRLARMRSGILAAWGAFIGLAPHLLHHVGLLAGAALIAGATGRFLFTGIGFVAAIPFLRQLYRRFATWRAPAIAFAVFVPTFSLSSFVIGPAIAGDGGSLSAEIEQRGDHDDHDP